MNTQIKWNNRNEILTVIGIQKSRVDGRLLLQIKGWKPNQVLDLKNATTLDDKPLTPEMFETKSAYSNLQEIKEILMWCNGWSERKLHGTWSDLLAEIQIQAEGLEGIGTNYGKTTASNKFVADICKRVRNYNRCSEKQAYIIAKYADEHGIVFKG